MPPADPPPGAAPGPDAAPGPEAAAPGLREQIGATRDSAKRLLGAHIELARAEFEEIGDAIKLAAALGGVAVAAIVVAALLAVVGTPLFLGEWIFGSIGWGLLHGILLLVGIATLAGMAAVGTPSSRLGRSFVVAAFIGIAVALFLGLGLTNKAWSGVGKVLVPVVALDSRPLVAALLTLPVVAGVVIGLLNLLRGLQEPSHGADAPSIGARIGAVLPAAVYVGWLVAFGYAYSNQLLMPDWRIFAAAAAGLVVTEVVAALLGRWRAGFDLLTGLSTGAALGVALTLLTALDVGRRMGAAIGLTAGLIAWPALMAADLASGGVDVEGLKKRFIPQQTIDMTKETIEWARARMPLSRKS